MAKLDMTPELESAIADVRAAASEFGEETAHFANGKFWIVSWFSWYLIFALFYAIIYQMHHTFSNTNTYV